MVSLVLSSTMTFSTKSKFSIASSTIGFNAMVFPLLYPPSDVITILDFESLILSRNDDALKPEKTTV